MFQINPPNSNYISDRLSSERTREEEEVDQLAVESVRHRTAQTPEA
jgi:hypothetical protein